MTDGKQINRVGLSNIYIYIPNKLPKSSHPDKDTFTDTYSDSEIEEVSTSFPSFRVLESIEEKPIIKLSPLAIERFLSANVAPRSVKTARNNTLIVEVTKKKYVDLLLKTTTLLNMKIKAYLHRSLNTSRGVVRSSELSSCFIEEIKHNLRKLQVSEVKRITIRKNDQLINTSTYILTFNTPKPPLKLKIGYMIANVDTYSQSLQLPKVWAL